MNEIPLFLIMVSSSVYTLFTLFLNLFSTHLAQYYAAKLAIARGPRTKETNEYLSHLLDALETVRKKIWIIFVFFFFNATFYSKKRRLARMKPLQMI